MTGGAVPSGDALSGEGPPCDPGKVYIRSQDKPGAMSHPDSHAELLASLSQRKGFIWKSSEIYGGISGVYDYGPNGYAVKRAWERLWESYFVRPEWNFFMLDAGKIMPEAALRASGHLDSFTDVLVTCGSCGAEYRGDHLLEGETAFEGAPPEAVRSELERRRVPCERCGSTLSEASDFNMMFPVLLGSRGTERGYLRPETAQAAYLNFRRCFEVGRRKLPLGIGVIGRAFRNEIAPRQGVYRMREFTQAELQVFFDPDHPPEVDLDRDMQLSLVFGSEREAERRLHACGELLSREEFRPITEFYLYWMCTIQRFYTDMLNVPLERFRFFEKVGDEKAFYNRVHFDVELDIKSLGGSREVAGLHYRGDWDLSRHIRHSGKDLTVNIDGRKVTPHVLELSFGVDRNVWSLLDLHLTQRRAMSGTVTVLRLPPMLAPYHVGVFPLLRKDSLPERAREVHAVLSRRFRCFYDESGSIGRRYARQDEIGTPYCVTIDHTTLQDDTVTVRDRDTTAQVRVGISDLVSELEARIFFRDAGGGWAL